MAIVRHLDANPKSSEKGIFELWTRQHFQSILELAAQDSLLPGYSQLSNHGHKYAFNGFYRIISVEVLKGAPVLEFLLAQRGEDVQQRRRDTQEVWERKVGAEWMKVRAERVRKEEQREDPALEAKERMEEKGGTRRYA